MKKAVFFDIDGTLIDCMNGITEITPKVKEAIRGLQANGDYVFLATGRPYAFLSKELCEFGFDGYILANGAHVMIHNESIFAEPIEGDFLREFLQKLEEWGMEYILESEKYSYLKNEFQYFQEFYDQVGMSRTFFQSKYRLEDVNPLKIEMYSKDAEIVKACIHMIDSYPEYDYFHSVNKAVIELYRKKNTKAAAIMTALEYLDIPVEQSYAFGDGINDIEMLSTVGCGIAMANASEEVKRYASKVTDSVHNDGVAIGIKKYVMV